VRENILYLTNLKLANKIDKEYGDSLILDQTKLHDSIFEELKLIYSTNAQPEVSIRIEGGLTSAPTTRNPSAGTMSTQPPKPDRSPKR
jgi:hypothetical protein